MKKLKIIDHLPATAAAASVVAYGVMETGGWQSFEPTIGGFVMASIGAWFARHAMRRQRDHHDDKPKDVLANDPAPWEIPETDSWCQYCDEIHPTAEFSRDIMGRWLCLDCRRLVDPDYQKPEPEPVEVVGKGGNYDDQKCVSCHYKVGTYFVKLADGHCVYMCPQCVGDMTGKKIKPSKPNAFSPSGWRAALNNNEPMLEETRQRLDKAEKARTRQEGKPQEVAGGEYVRSMYGHRVVVTGVDKGGIVKVDGMNCRAKISKDVLALGRVRANGMGAEIFIAGNVGQGATIRAEGMNARIVILGHIAAGAKIRAEGMGAVVEYGGVDPRSGTTIVADGMNSQVIQKGRAAPPVSYDVTPGTVWEAPEDKRGTEKKPPCAVCGAESYYYMNIAGGGSEHRCVRCAARPRRYTAEEQAELVNAHQADIDKLAAIHGVPAPQVGLSEEERVALKVERPSLSVYDQATKAAEMTSFRYRTTNEQVQDSLFAALRETLPEPPEIL